MSGIPSAYRQLRSLLSQQGEIVRWVVFVFLGGSINGVAWQVYANFISYYARIPTPTTQSTVISLIVVILVSAGLFLVPILLSLSLTRFLPSRQLVPPFYMNIIALGFFANYLYTLYHGSPDTAIFDLYIALFYTALGGVFQDRISVGIVGKGAVREDIIGYAFTVNCDIPTLRSLLSNEQYARRININRNWYESKDGGVVFPPSEKGFSISIALKKKSDDWTLMSVCIWNEGRYNFVRTAELEEFASDKVAYLKDILSNPRVGENRAPIPFARAVSTDLDRMIDNILDEAGGSMLTSRFSMNLVIHTERISTVGWIQLVLFVAITGICIALLVIGGTDETLAGVGGLVSIAVYLVFQLPQNAQHQRVNREMSSTS